MKDVLGKNIDVKGKRLFLFDMDGTLYLENRLFDGVIELLNKIRDIGGRYAFITNNSSKSVEDYVAKMKRLGVSVGKEDFYTSTQAACDILRPLTGERSIYAQGTASFIKELKEGGLNVTTSYDKDICAILVGYDTELTYEKLRLTCKLLTELNVPYYATNPDFVCPVDFGYAPDCGSMCFGIEKATGKSPTYIGKPQPDMIYAVMKKYGYTKEETVVFGDRIYTDIAAGAAAGVDTFCVLSGECTLSDVEQNKVKPTYVVQKATDITKLL